MFELNMASLLVGWVYLRTFLILLWVLIYVILKVAPCPHSLWFTCVWITRLVWMNLDLEIILVMKPLSHVFHFSTCPLGSAVIHSFVHLFANIYWTPPVSRACSGFWKVCCREHISSFLSLVLTFVVACGDNRYRNESADSGDPQYSAARGGKRWVRVWSNAWGQPLPLSKHRSDWLGGPLWTEATECWALGTVGVWRREAWLVQEWVEERAAG